MLELDEMINQFEECKLDVSDKKNCCLDIFNGIVKKELIDEDTYYSAKAFCSIVNNIINNKVDNVLHISTKQIDLLQFLQTYDDKYLSNLTNCLMTKSYCEIDFVNELLVDIFEILTFLEDTLKEITNKKKDNFSHIQQQLNDMLKEFEEKYKGDDFNE